MEHALLKGGVFIKIEIDNLTGPQARYLIKFADMMRVATITKDKIEPPLFPGNDPIKTGTYHEYQEEFENVAKIQQMIDEDALYP